MKSFYFGRCKFNLEGMDSLGELDLFVEEKPYTFEVTGRVTRDKIPGIHSFYTPDELTAIAKTEEGYLFYATRDKENPKEGILVDFKYENIKSCGEEIKKVIGNEGPNEVLIDTGFKRLRVVYDAILPMHGGTALHASCVKYKDKAVCFCGPSGTGKSTHASLWEACFGAPMISSDTPTVYPEKNGGATVFGMPWDGSDHIITQESKPLIAIVELRQAKHNSMRKLSHNQAFQLLLHQGHMPMWDQEAMFMEMAVLKKLSSSVVFYRLNCLPEKGAAELAEAVLFGNDLNYCEEETELKVKDGYILREVMGDYIVMPAGDNMKKFEGALVLSETSAFVWEKLQKNVSKSDLLKDVLAEFDVDEATASKDIDDLIEKLKSLDVIDEID